MNRNRQHPLHGLHPPKAPTGLRQRTLEAARAVSTEPITEQPTRSFADRLWASRPLRLAWVLAMVGLLGANLALEFDRMAGLPDETPLGDLSTLASDRKPGEPQTLLEARRAMLQPVLRDDLAEDPQSLVPRRTS